MFALKVKCAHGQTHIYKYWRNCMWGNTHTNTHSLSPLRTFMHTSSSIHWHVDLISDCILQCSAKTKTLEDSRCSYIFPLFLPLCLPPSPFLPPSVLSLIDMYTHIHAHAAREWPVEKLHLFSICQPPCNLVQQINGSKTRTFQNKSPRHWSAAWLCWSLFNA